jgi:purine-binding chemotaxis protein CheW
MLKKKKYVIFWLDNQKFALHISNIERVVRIVEVSLLSKSPKYILGIINFQGEFLPVINLRILFDLNDRDIDLSDQLIITNTIEIKVALWVDCVSDIIEREDEKIIESNKILIESKYNEGAFKFNDELVVIHDLDAFLNFNKKSLLKTIDKKKVVNK